MATEAHAQCWRKIESCRGALKIQVITVGPGFGLGLRARSGSAFTFLGLVLVMVGAEIPAFLNVLESHSPQEVRDGRNSSEHQARPTCAKQITGDHRRLPPSRKWLVPEMTTTAS